MNLLLSLFLIMLFSIIFSMATDGLYYNIDKADEYFEEFIIKHGKNYQHDEEKRQRFEIFKDNLIRINHLKTFNENIGVNQFTDMTEKEFSEQYNSCLDPPQAREGVSQYSACKVITDADVWSIPAPFSLDYRKLNAVSSVKNQLQCKCCWAFASVGSLEGRYAMRYKRQVSLSAQQLMDCLPSSGHCYMRGNSMITAFSELIMTPGVESDADYPYKARDQTCRMQPPKAVVRVTGCYNFQLRNEELLKQALTMFGPIAIAINVEPIQWLNNFRGIIDSRMCPPGKLGHAVLLVGYGTENGRDYWIIKNSAGLNWGGPDQGYIRFYRRQNVCGMLNILAASGEIA